MILNDGIQKKLIHGGKQAIDYPDGTKVYFHYKSVIQEDGTVLDDSKKLNPQKPMELIIGKKFKLEVWEQALKTMWLHEVSKFSVMKDLLFDYPVAAKQLREYYQSIAAEACGHKHEPQQRQHCCGYNVMEHGVGYADLDKLIKEPKDLEFIFELIRVELPGEYEKDSWAMSEEEKIVMVPKLKEEGNKLVGRKMYGEAVEKYEEALRYLEQFMLKEKPNDIDWNKLNEQKLPILFNFSLCKFHLKDYYGCIEHASTILEFQPRNVKALFRRGKAHMEVWNVEEARKDMDKCREIDPSVEAEVQAQLDYMSKVIAQKEKGERKKYKGKMFN